MDNQILIHPLLIILFSLLLSAFFSGIEIAYISSNRLKIELDRKHGLFSSRFISIFLNKPGHFIATMLVGNNIALVIYGFFVATLLEPVITNQLNVTSSALMLFLQTLAGTIVILFTAEFLPKTVFRSRPNASLNIFALPVMVFYILLYPITIITLAITNFIMRHILGMRVRMRGENQNPVFGKIDLDHLVIESQKKEEEESELEPEKKIFQNALEFSNLKTRDCMVPRTEIEALEINRPIQELKKRFTDTGYSKILIYEDSIDNITGYINSKDLFKDPGSIEEMLVPLSIVPETMKVNKLFRKLIKEQKSITLVVDEFGGTSGIITIEDIIEEIFGEIEDEHDTFEFTERQVKPGEYIFSGRLEIDYLNDQYSLNLPVSEEYETLAGYIIHHQESIPKLNTRVLIDEYRYRILKVTDTRIELVHIKKTDEN